MLHDRSARYVLAIVLLIAPLVTSACSVFGDDDDDDSSPEMRSELTAEESGAATAGGGATTSGAAVQATAGEPAASAEDEPGGRRSGEEPNLTTVVQEVTEEVRPAVVFIAVTQTQLTPFGGEQEQQGVGSGVIFDAAEGLILTNNHVVEGADELSVVLPDGRQFPATIVGRAPQQDVAVIQIEGGDLPSARLAENDDLAIGEWVIAIGNALGLQGGASVTVGVVSALDRTLRPSETEPPMEGLIQTDAAINPGNSGGPLVNLEGEVIGINTAKIPRAEGIGFAVPIGTAREIIDQILSGEPQATLGVSVATVTPELALRYGLPVDRGVLVIELEVDGPAAVGGMQPGDIIVAFDGAPIEGLDQLRAALDAHVPGDIVNLTVNRAGQEQQFEIELGASNVIR